MSLLAAIRLVRLNEDMPGYQSLGTAWGWDGSQMTRPRNDEGRILPGLRDWITERQTARLIRLAHRAPESTWSRICRWQVGMAAGWSLGLWIFGVVIYVHAMTWWILTKERNPARAVILVTSFVLSVLPVIAGGFRVLGGGFEPGRGLLLPVQRKSYIRRLGMAAALSQFQLWAGLSVVLLLWWLLAAPLSFPHALFAGMLVSTAAFQVVLFGLLAWTARYRSKGSRIFVVVLFLPATFIVQIVWMSSPCPLPQVLWIAGITAVVGLLITLDAYRRWLAVDFD